jgi:protein-S-isoprenylcysteine O-methyltransferase Ste14
MLMENKSIPTVTKDHPAVYLPPPIVYVSVFFISVVCQKVMALPHHWFAWRGIRISAMFLIAAGVSFLATSIWRFIVSKNTLIPIKPAQSLQTTGIYAISRNPMYLALLCLYLGIAILKGNTWTLILSPIVVLIIQSYVIRKEEDYLTRAFGDAYLNYMAKVRRWI